MSRGLTRLHLVVRGRVQGVGFRWFARRTAEELGISGWARNLADGTVELEAEGPEASVGRFVEVLRAGCPPAEVDAVESRKVAARGETGFRTY